MSLSVDYVYQFALKLIRKNQAGSLSSVDFAYQWNDAQGSYQDDLLGRFQPRGNSKTGANIGLIQDETILTKLAIFTKPVTIITINGRATKPLDFIYTLAMRVGGKKVTFINKDQIATVNDSVIDPPSVANGCYYATEYQTSFSIFPDTITSVDLDYICTPTDVFWNYDLDGDGRQVYNSVGSVQPAWDSNSCREITKRMLANLGVSFKDTDFANFGKSVQLTGE